jgi:hypothetical protein
MSMSISKTLLGVAVCLALLTSTVAQVQTQTTLERRTPVAQSVQVDRAEVVYVSGNDLMIKMGDGRLEHVVVPDEVTVAVDDKELRVRDLKPGMTLHRTITTTATPATVTTTKTVEGTVFHVILPNFVILTLADGTNQRFRIPSGQKFVINGKETDAFGLRKGMKVSATAITEMSGVVTTREVEHAGQMPSAAAAPPPTSALLVVVNGPLASEFREMPMSGRDY